MSIDQAARGLAIKSFLGQSNRCEAYGASPSATAAVNVAALQSAFNASGFVTLTKPGTYSFNAPTVISSNTTFQVGMGVTLLQAPGTNNNLLQNAAYTRPWTTITSISWSNTIPLEATINIGGGFTVVKDQYIWVQGTPGTTDPAYTGVFRVIDATTPGAPIVMLNNIPAAAASGTITAKLADVNISLIGGTYNYDYANNPGVAGPRCHGIMLIGTANSNVTNVTTLNTKKFGICTGATANLNLNGLDHSGPSDGIKCYGPCANSVFSNLSVDNADDGISIHPQEPAAFSAYDVSHGNIINVRVNNTKVYNGSGVKIYGSDYWYMDNIIVDGVMGHSTTGVGVAANTIPLVCFSNYSALAICTMGSVIIRNVELRSNWYRTTLGQIEFNTAGSYATNFKSILFEHIITDPNAGEVSASRGILINLGGGTVPKLTVRNSVFYNPASCISIQLAGSDNYGGITFNDNYVESLHSGDGELCRFDTTGTIGTVNGSNNVIAGLTDYNFLNFDSILGNTPTVILRGNNVTANYFVVTKTNLNLVMIGNRLVGMAGSAISITGAGSKKVTLSSSGNTWAGTYYGIAATNSIAFAGNCADFKCDLSATGIARSDGAIVYNTNAALGTLASKGLVLGHGPSNAQAATVTSAAPGVFTVAASSPIGTAVTLDASVDGFTAATQYFVSATGWAATTFSLADTYAHALAGTNNITSSGTTGMNVTAQPLWYLMANPALVY
jgi:hypothetical protein